MKTHLKVAVLKLGARITTGGTSGGSGEAMSICKMLARGGADTHIYTKILAKDELSPEFQWHQILEEGEDINSAGMDALVVINGSVNYMGGAPVDESTINYLIINKFKGPVFYIYCDPNLILNQLWKTVDGKNAMWKEKYNARTWTEEEINITRTDIRVICQSYNTEYVATRFAKAKVPVQQITNYPFDKFPLLNKKTMILSDPITDISYGGTMRTGRREKKLIDFYFGYPEDISVEVFGKIKVDQFNPKKIDGLSIPVFTGAVNYDKMISKMSEAMAHIVIGDDMYTKFDIMSQRTYEAVLAGCATFVDESLDVNKRMYGGNKELSDFLYVSNRDQVIDRVRSLKAAGPDAAREMADDILEHFNFNAQDYCSGLVDILKAQA